MKRHLFLLIDLACVATCAALLGHAAAGAVGRGLVASPPTGRSALGPAVPPTRPVPEAIAARNLFCSTCGFPGPRDATSDVAGSGLTQLPLALVAVNLVVGPPLGQWAMATIRHKETGWVGAFLLGEQVLGARVTAIEPSRVVLEEGAARAVLSLLGEEGPAVPETPVLRPGLQRIGANQYSIDRALLEESLGNLNAQAQSVRLLPESNAGQPAGFRLVQLRPDSLLDHLGLRRGDLLLSINGLELTSVEKVMELYLKLKSASHLALVVRREGSTATLQYTVR